MTSSVQVYLSSKYATTKLNGTQNSDMVFLFDTPVVPPYAHNMTIKLLNLYVPISFTNININNNVLIVDSVEYDIPSGNYSASSLVSALSSLLTGFTISFSTITNQITFSKATDFTFSGDSTCLSVLGFEDGYDISSSGGVLTSFFPIDLTGDNTLYVDLRNISTPNLASSTSGTTSIIHSINQEVPYGSVLFYEHTTDFAHVIQQDHLSFFHVRLLGEDQITPLDLQNHDWGLTLIIGFVPKQPQATIPSTFTDFYTQYLQSLQK